VQFLTEVHFKVFEYNYWAIEMAKVTRMRLVKVHEVVAPIQVADVFTKSLLEEH
jgi:hypothetical protein